MTDFVFYSWTIFLSRNSQQNEKKSATNLLSFCNVEANGWSVTQLTCGYISVLIISLTGLVDGGRQFVCNTNSNLIEEKLQALLFNFFFKTEICCPLTNSYLVLI